MKNWLGLAMVAILIALGAALIASTVREGHEQKVSNVSQGASIPLASSPQSEWTKLVIPAGGKSERIQVPSGMHILVAGNRVVLHTVYADGHECTSNERCQGGPIAGSYLTNESAETNIVSYSFAAN